MFFNPNSKITQALEKVADVIILSIYWVLTTLTIIGAGSAGVGLYHAAAKSLRRDRGSVSRAFFSAIKDSWKATLPIGLILAVFGVSVYLVDVPNLVNLLAYDSTGELVLGIISCVKILFVVAIALYILPILSRFQVGAVRAFAFSVMLALRHLGTTLYLLVLLALCIGLVVWQSVLILAVPAVFAILWSRSLDRVLKLYMPDADTQTDDDRWYLE